MEVADTRPGRSQTLTQTILPPLSPMGHSLTKSATNIIKEAEAQLDKVTKYILEEDNKDSDVEEVDNDGFQTVSIHISIH